MYFVYVPAYVYGAVQVYLFKDINFSNLFKYNVLINDNIRPLVATYPYRPNGNYLCRFR